jgi:hypothetical protein
MLFIEATFAEADVSLAAQRAHLTTTVGGTHRARGGGSPRLTASLLPLAMR